MATGKRADQTFAKPDKAATLTNQVFSGGDETQPLVSSTKEWQLPRASSVKFGHPAVSWVHQWWSKTGRGFLAAPSKLQWISFLQLYIDYQLCTGQGGPLLWNSRWFFGDRFQDEDYHPGYVKRCKWFQMLLKHYWLSNGFEFRSRSIRPASGAICCWLVTVELCWPQERLDRIDAVILELNKGGLHKGIHVDAFSHMPILEDWAVGSPNTGFTGFA